MWYQNLEATEKKRCMLRVYIILEHIVLPENSNPELFQFSTSSSSSSFILMTKPILNKHTTHTHARTLLCSGKNLSVRILNVKCSRCFPLVLLCCFGSPFSVIDRTEHFVCWSVAVFHCCLYKYIVVYLWHFFPSFFLLFYFF